MSKNYELLRKTGKDLELFVADTPKIQGEEVGPLLLGSGARIREEILKLIQRTFLTGVPGAPRRVVFTAVDYGSGCSWVCARAAEALAANGDGAVCVVEAHQRTPSIHRYFGASKAGGLADAMQKKDPLHSFARPLRGTNLWLISSEDFPLDATGATNFEQLKKRFAELSSQFNYVLVDAPPLNEAVNTIMFGRLTDGVILVLEANVTRREAARRAKKSLETANIKLLGAVLNKRTYPIPDALYNRI